MPNGESLVFWVDLSAAKLLDGNFTWATSTTLPGSGGVMTPTSSTRPLKWVLPYASIGNSNYISVYSDNGVNYFSIQATTSLATSASYGTTGLTVNQAYSIDQKTDDGLPGSGRVLAEYQNGYQCGATPTCAPHSYSPMAYAASSSNCFDNGGVYGVQKYSITQNTGAAANCALSFKIQ